MLDKKLAAALIVALTALLSTYFELPQSDLNGARSAACLHALRVNPPSSVAE